MTFRPLIPILCFMALLANGCISIHGRFNGLTSYYKISKKECGDLFCAGGSALGSNADSCVIKLTNGKAVKAYLADFSKSVVYIWAPECHGSSCPNINWLRQKCESEHLKLLIVSGYFDCHKTLIFFDKAHPVTGIDTRYYKTDFTDGYLRKFLSDLTDIK